MVKELRGDGTWIPCNPSIRRDEGRLGYPDAWGRYPKLTALASRLKGTVRAIALALSAEAREDVNLEILAGSSEFKGVLKLIFA